MKTQKMLFLLILSLIFSCTENENKDEKKLEIQTVIEEKDSLDEELIFEEELELVIEQKGANLPTKSETTEALETIYESKSNANDEIILEEQIETIVEQH